MNRIKTIFPITGWISGYNRGLFKWDLIAGITLAMFVLPTSMAYASLAGVPAQYGIYCCIVGGLFFAFFTNIPQIAVGPTSAISLMVGTTVALLSGGDPGRWAEIASLTAFIVFILCMAAYFLKLSILVNFISENILLGFKTGAALSIAVTQLPKLFAVEGGGNNFFESIYTLCIHLPQTNLTIFLFGLTALGLLALGNRLLPGWPISLLITIGSILVVTYSPLSGCGFQTIGDIPSGLPHFKLPSLHFHDVDGILELALGCFLVGYIETITAARIFSEEYGYEINPRHELLSLGAANFSAAFASGYPVSGGLSQSTVNDKAGAKTPFALIICSAALSIILLYFTGLLKNLPVIILAVLVLDAVGRLIKIKELRIVWSLSKFEFSVAIIAISGVLVFGILKGVLIAVVTSLIIIIMRASAPNIAILGRIPGTDKFSDIKRHPDNEEIQGCKIFRIEAAVFYFNQNYIYTRLMELIKGANHDLKLVVLDMSSAPGLDISGSKMLVRLSNELEKMQISFKIVEALSEVREILRKQGMEKVIGHISRKVTIINIISNFLNPPVYGRDDEIPE